MYRSRLAIAGINLLSRQSKWTSVEYLVPPLNDKNIVNTAKKKKFKKYNNFFNSKIYQSLIINQRGILTATLAGLRSPYS